MKMEATLTRCANANGVSKRHFITPKVLELFCYLTRSTHKHTHMHMYTCIHIHIKTPTTHTCTHTCKHKHTHICKHTCIHTYTSHMHTYMYTIYSRQIKADYINCRHQTSRLLTLATALGEMCPSYGHPSTQETYLREYEYN